MIASTTMMIQTTPFTAHLRLRGHDARAGSHAGGLTRVPATGVRKRATMDSAQGTADDARMASLIITCRVEDPEHWLASPVRDALFATFGVTALRTFVNPRDPTSVALLVDTPPPPPDEVEADLRVVLAAMADHPAVRDALAVDRVVPGSMEFHFER